MDFEKIALSTILCRFSVEDVAHYIRLNEENLVKSGEKKFDILDLFAKIARWDNSAFTESELDMLQNLVKNEWTYVENEDINKELTISKFSWLFLKFANKLLVVGEDGKPIVKFDQLFRWRELSLITGEDLLSVAYIAGNDVINNHCSISLLDWPDILLHDSKTINSLMNKGVADVHSHFGASGNIFEINWIWLMNRSNLISSSKKSTFDILQNPVVSYNIESSGYSYKQMFKAAVFLRFKLFKLVHDQNDSIVNELYKSIEILKETFPSNIELQKEINVVLQSSIKVNGSYFDYALIQSYPSIYDILCGERIFLYKFFYGLFRYNRAFLIAAPYFYLYILIKSKFRQEFIETNKLIGFQNFQTYQNRKSIYSIKNTRDHEKMENNEAMRELVIKYILNSNLINPNNKLETRCILPVMENIFDILHYPLMQNSLISNSISYKDLLKDIWSRLTFVVTFSKKRDYYKKNLNRLNDSYERFKNYKSNSEKSLKFNMDELLGFIKCKGSYNLCSGIDAVGNELVCRPEVFAHVYRYARLSGIYTQTYHVGEDFFDLVDGLRSIDECIRFLEFDKHCRLGHALALGIDVSQYYNRRHFCMVLSKQYYLDNLIWLYQTIRKFDISVPQSILYNIENDAFKIYSDIGYRKPFSILNYWHSMLLRGDDYASINGERKFDTWGRSALCRDEEVCVARKDKDAVDLYSQYLTDLQIRENGDSSLATQWEKCIVDILPEIQNKMISVIKLKQISIESNPSSNIMIGALSQYDEHPLFRFMPMKKSDNYVNLNVSINTDDRGIFQTTIYNEYSLIALAMKKMKDPIPDEKIISYLDRIRENSFEQLFKPVILR